MLACTPLPQAAGGVEMDVAADGSKVKVGASCKIGTLRSVLESYTPDGLG